MGIMETEAHIFSENIEAPEDIYVQPGDMVVVTAESKASLGNIYDYRRKDVRVHMAGDLPAYRDIRAERKRQQEIWPDGDVYFNKPHLQLAILTEEVGEVARAINDRDLSNFREELVQVAAVAVAMIEAVDNGRTIDMEPFWGENEDEDEDKDKDYDVDEDPRAVPHDPNCEFCNPPPTLLYPSEPGGRDRSDYPSTVDPIGSDSSSISPSESGYPSFSATSPPYKPFYWLSWWANGVNY